jgi:hypothetical protein
MRFGLHREKGVILANCLQPTFAGKHKLPDRPQGCGILAIDRFGVSSIFSGVSFFNAFVFF